MLQSIMIGTQEFIFQFCLEFIPNSNRIENCNLPRNMHEECLYYNFNRNHKLPSWSRFKCCKTLRNYLFYRWCNGLLTTEMAFDELCFKSRIQWMHRLNRCQHIASNHIASDFNNLNCTDIFFWYFSLHSCTLSSFRQQTLIFMSKYC